MPIRTRNQLRREIWYINAGILSDTAFTKAIKDLSESIKPESLFNTVIFMTIDYLVHYFELLSINPSKLLINCIKKHLQFVETLLSQKKNRYLSSTYWDVIFEVCDKFATTDDYVERQFCVDAIERISHFLTSRTRFWVQSNVTLMMLRLFDRKSRNTVVYNSFLIPNNREYKDPFTDPDQKNFEKIENECYCKIFLNYEHSDCRIGEGNMILEVLFDYYKGNFLGFLDSLLYLVKRIHPTKYFIKSLRTVTQTESMCFMVLSDLPIKQLRLIEKEARMGEMIQPFLHSSASSKTVFRILIDDVKEAVKLEIDKVMSAQEDIDYWRRQMSETEIKQYKDIVFNFICDYECWTSILKEWTRYKQCTDRRPNRQFNENLTAAEIAELDRKYKRNKEKKERVTIEGIDKDGCTFAIDEINEEKEKCIGVTKTVSFEESIMRSMENSYVKILSSRLSLRMNRGEASLLIPNVIQSKLAIYFNALYDRVYHMRNEPENFLNHTLRVMLRCNTEYEYGDEELAKLDHATLSLNQLLKNFYNFDLTKGTFFTSTQRKTSMFNREDLKRQHEKALERQHYLENRRIIAEQIENTVCEDMYEEERLKTETPSLSTSTEEIMKQHESVLTDGHDNYEDLVLNGDILFGDIRETKELLSPDFKKAVFAVFGPLSNDLLQLFNEKRIIQLPVWLDNIKDKISRFENKFPFKHKSMPCDATDAYKGQINPDQVDMVYSSVSTNVYVSIKLLSGHDPKFDVEFSKMLKGQGIQINFLNEINKSSSNLPRLLSLVDNRQHNLRKNLNHNLCVMCFDIYLICASLNSAFGNLFDHHYAEMKASLDKSNNEIKDLYNLFEFEEKLDEAKALFKLRLLNRTKSELGILLKLSEDFRRFNELLFKSECCNWRNAKCMRILYVSMSIYGNKKCQEPFLRKGGDRRLKKIETKGNCIITMRLTTHPVTGVLIPFVEIFYDFFKGNHFCTMDMLKMIFAEDRGSTARIVNTRHLLILPYGELWIVQDLEWLRTRGSFMLAQETQ